MWYEYNMNSKQVIIWYLATFYSYVDLTKAFDTAFVES